MAQRILGIDLGAWSVKAVLLESNFRSHQVIAAHEQPVDPVDPEDETDSPARRQDAALVALLARPELKADHVVAALPGELCSIRYIRLPFSDAKKINQTIEGELADALPFDVDEAAFDHVLQHKDAEGSVSLAVATPKDKLAAFLSRLQADGVDPKFLGVDSLQLFNLFSHYLAEDSSPPEQPSQTGEVPASVTPAPDLAPALPPEPSADLALTEPGIAAPEPSASPVASPASASTSAPAPTASASAASDPGTASISEPAPAPDLSAALPPGRLLLDIGHERTLLMVAGPDGVAHSRVIHEGGAAVTEAISQSFQLSRAEAEQAKHQEGALATPRYPAPTDLAAQLSEVIAHGLSPLLRELRRTLQSIRRERRVRITRVDLVGGGSRLRHLASYLAHELSLPVAQGRAVEQAVERQLSEERRPAFGLALALALRPAGAQQVSRIELRRGEFSFAGSLENLRRRLPFVAAALVGLLLLALITAGVRLQVAASRLDAVNEQFCLATEQVVGRRVCEPSVALSLLAQPTGALGSFAVPTRSAFVVAADISSALPRPLAKDTEITELDVNHERARIEGKTTSFEAVDQISAALAKNPCFAAVKKSRLNKDTDGKQVEFQLMLRLKECSR